MRILLVGDVHGNTTFLKWCYEAAHREDCSAVVQLGDLAYAWPGRRAGGSIEDTAEKLAAERTGIPFYFLDGNHDNHELLEHDADHMVEVRENVFYLPRGHSWTWGDKKFVSLGGAFSIDKWYRTAYISWWPDEQPSAAQLERAFNHGSCDVLLTHECPGQHVIPTSHHAQDREMFPEAAKQRDALEEVMLELQPRHVFHGHWHHRYDKDVLFLPKDEDHDDEFIRRTTIHGLGADVTKPWTDSIYILEV